MSIHGNVARLKGIYLSPDVRSGSHKQFETHKLNLI